MRIGWMRGMRLVGLLLVLFDGGGGGAEVLCGQVGFVRAWSAVSL